MSDKLTLKDWFWIGGQVILTALERPDLEPEPFFKSCAAWPNGSISTDIHRSKSAAEAVCRSLNRDGFGGQGVVFPTRTWVEPCEVKS